MSRPTRTLPPTPAGLTEAETGEPLTDIAYRKVKSAILDGSLPPSLLASEQQIAGRLAMSRTPVHQAIVRLQQEGWIELLPRRGVMIAPISAPDMHDVYEALLALEVAAVRRLSSWGAPESDPTLSALEKTCDDGDAALGNGDLPAWAAADDRFHASLVDLSGNRHITRLARSVMEQAQRARLLTLKLRPHPGASNADHRAIVQAIKAGDPDLAGERMRAHRQRGMDVLLPILEALSTKRGFLSNK